MEANISSSATGAGPLALAAEIRGATSVTVIERGTDVPVWTVAVERSPAVGVHAAGVLTVPPSEVRAAVAHIVAAVHAADAIAGAGGGSEGWTELILVDDRHLFLIRALTATITGGLIVCLTLDRRDTTLAAARREFERLVTAEMADVSAGLPGPPADASVERRPAGPTARTRSKLPRRTRRAAPPVAHDFEPSWATEADLSRIVDRLRRSPGPTEHETFQIREEHRDRRRQDPGCADRPAG